jgi:hypothetical protein
VSKRTLAEIRSRDAALDDQILKLIESGTDRLILSRFELLNGMNFYDAHYLLDRRLQSLRKRGLIAYDPRRREWRIKEGDES